MAAFKNLLITHEVVTAGRQRKCYHSKNCQITKGDRVLEVKADQGVHGYCLTCARSMVANATAALAQLSSKIDGE